MLFKRFLWTYIWVTVFIVFAGGVSLYKDWRAYELEQATQLVEHAGLTATQLDSALLDASRMVDVAKSKFASRKSGDQITDKEAHEILRRTVSEFKFSTAKQYFGILFFVDDSGTIRAQNLEFPAEHYDVSDRLYFVDAKSDPDEDWHIGEQVIGRTNHQRVFHYAVSLRNSENRFAGLLLQQIKIDATPIFQTNSKLHESEHIIAFQPSGHIAFEHPYPSSLDVTGGLATKAYAAVTKESEPDTSGWLKSEYSATQSTYGSYVAYVRSPLFGMTTIATIPTTFLWIEFLKKSALFILLGILGFLVVSYLFLRLYKETVAKRNEHAVAMHDPLTNLLNRRALDEEMPRIIGEARRNGLPLTFMFIDIDHFNEFNNKFGHLAGDQALVAVSNTIKNVFHRAVDVSCRWGGEEFVAVLPNTDPNGARYLADLLRTRIKEIRLNVNHVDLPPITVSIGVVSAQVTALNQNDDFIKLADKLMYEAKSAGRDCCRHNF